MVFNIVSSNVSVISSNNSFNSYVILQSYSGLYENSFVELRNSDGSFSVRGNIGYIGDRYDFYKFNFIYDDSLGKFRFEDPNIDGTNDIKVGDNLYVNVEGNSLDLVVESCEYVLVGDSYYTLLDFEQNLSSYLDSNFECYVNIFLGYEVGIDLVSGVGVGVINSLDISSSWDVWYDYDSSSDSFGSKKVTLEYEDKFLYFGEGLYLLNYEFSVSGNVLDSLEESSFDIFNNFRFIDTSVGVLDRFESYENIIKYINIVFDDVLNRTNVVVSFIDNEGNISDFSNINYSMAGAVFLVEYSYDSPTNPSFDLCGDNDIICIYGSEFLVRGKSRDVYYEYSIEDDDFLLGDRIGLKDFNSSGNYTIKVKSRDYYGKYSDIVTINVDLEYSKDYLIKDSSDDFVWGDWDNIVRLYVELDNFTGIVWVEPEEYDIWGENLYGVYEINAIYVNVWCFEGKFSIYTLEGVFSNLSFLGIDVSDGLSHPADLDNNYRLDIEEVCKYLDLYVNGSPIQESFKNKAMELWLNGEFYGRLEDVEEPNCWINLEY